MIKVFECTQEIYNFQNMIRNLEDFCKDLPLDIYVSYVYDTSRNEDEYYVSISDFETYEDRIVTYIRFKYYPKTDIYEILFTYFVGDRPDHTSTFTKIYSPTNHDTFIKSADDIYEEIIEYIKKGIFGYEMDKENK